MFNVDTVINTIDDAANSYFRLVLIIAPESSTKALVLEKVQEIVGTVSVNIGAEISQRLLEMTERQRTLRLPDLLDDALNSYPLEQVVILDNIEILFDQSLALNPLSLLQKLSRNRTIIVFWNGYSQDGWLTYAVPGHLEYRRYPTQDVFIIHSGA